jgi:hypothetical protein
MNVESLSKILSMLGLFDLDQAESRALSRLSLVGMCAEVGTTSTGF